MAGLKSEFLSHAKESYPEVSIEFVDIYVLVCAVDTASAEIVNQVFNVLIMYRDTDIEFFGSSCSISLLLE